MKTEDIQWAGNKQKLLRSIAFVNAGLGVQIVSDEKREQMIKEYYIQIGGLIVDTPQEAVKAKLGRPKKKEINDAETPSATDSVAPAA